MIELNKSNRGVTMSVVIVGGNECMIREYIELCRSYDCKAKVYPKMCRGLQNVGNPDLMVLFTNTISHKMVRCAIDGIKNLNIPIERSHNSSKAALKNILEKYS